MGRLSERHDLLGHVQAVPGRRLAMPFSTSPDVITAAADDFGHLMHTVPQAVAFPRSTWEVAELVRYASSAGLAVRARGAGHSVAGQAQCEGIVCDLSHMNRIYEAGDGWVSVAAGARWSAVLAAMMARGRTPPVLTDYLELTVGGTLAAGGIGGASYLHGPQVDQVLELELVTPSGEIVTCTSSSEAFGHPLASQGHGGIITRATIPLAGAPERVRRYKIVMPDVRSMTACQLRIAHQRRFGYLEGQIALDEAGCWTYIVEAGAYYSGSLPADWELLDELTPDTGPVETEDLSYLEFCRRMEPGVRLLAASGHWYQPHPWFSVFLPADAIVPFVTQALTDLTPEMAGPIPALLYPLRRGQIPARGLVTPAGEGLFFAFSILRTVRDDPALIRAALDGNSALADAAIAAGGTVYGLSALPAPARSATSCR